MDSSAKNIVSNSQKIYFIGIKGSGMVALAEVLHRWGKQVLGSDTKEYFFTQEILEKEGILFYEGFSEENIKRHQDCDLVVYSTAYTPERNVELAYAIGQGMKCLSYPEAVGEMMRDCFGIAVCGTHGKTTTSAMLTLAMQAAGADPSAIIGSRVTQLGSSGVAGQSQFFVVEADEYQNKFLHYAPLGVVLTSVDFDHPDFFKTFDDYKKAFKEFVRRIPAHGFLVAWVGSHDTLEVAKEARCRLILYGESLSVVEKENVQAEFAKAGKDTLHFVETPENLALSVPGRHNRLNATAALAVCQHLKLDQTKAKAALENYQGTSRRFEILGKYQGAIIVDDYAHHPQEIQATLAAAREKFPDKKIICVFHPHTFTRTQALLDEFAVSFNNCDEVVVLDIYGSAREKQGGIHSQDLVERIKENNSAVRYLSTIDQAFHHFKDVLTEKDVLITMGAGNVNELGAALVKNKQNEREE